MRPSEEGIIYCKGVMGKLSFQDIRDKGLLLYEYIRGSHCHGINTPISDVDTGGIYMCPPEQILGLGYDYQSEILSEKSDDAWFELNKFFRLLLKSNPSVLESLFVDDEFVIYEHPIITELKKHRDMFITQDCFKHFYGYAKEQIEKARGLNKKIVNPVENKKSLLDFCYVPYEQGSKSVEKWLHDNGLKQKYCGLVCLPNMLNMYGLYYDWGTHIICEYGVDLRDKSKLMELYWKLYKETNTNGKTFLEMWKQYASASTDHTYEFKQIEPYGFRGIVKEEAESDSVRVCTVPTNIVPITFMSYNENGYRSHCKDYYEYQKWKKNRNEIRYKSNLGHNYDAKNMCECFRLMHMCYEIAKGEGIHVNRKNIDADFLLDVKNHKFEYEDLIDRLEEFKAKMEAAMAVSTLPLSIDVDTVNKRLLDIRFKQLELLKNKYGKSQNS